MHYILREMKNTSGIHHITAITGDPQKNIDFYEGFLGQKLIKRTVNFDDPRSYHFYFGDAYGKPGTLLTFFYWQNIPKRSPGVGEVSCISYGIGKEAVKFWKKRAKEFKVPCAGGTNDFGQENLTLADPDGMVIELVVNDEETTVDWWKEGSVPEDADLRGFYGATLNVVSSDAMGPVLNAIGYEKKKEAGEYTRFMSTAERAHTIDLFEAPDLPQARQGSGSVHHVAFRAATDEKELEIRSGITELGLNPTHVIDRQYFHSVYFMTPARILFEIATDAPGFGVDENIDMLGERLVLPPQYEPHRKEIESILVPVTLPRHGKK